MTGKLSLKEQPRSYWLSYSTICPSKWLLPGEYADGIIRDRIIRCHCYWVGVPFHVSTVYKVSNSGQPYSKPQFSSSLLGYILKLIPFPPNILQNHLTVFATDECLLIKNTHKFCRKNSLWKQGYWNRKWLQKWLPVDKYVFRKV